MVAAIPAAQRIHFPALTIARDGTIQSYDDYAGLTHATPVAMAKRYFDGLIIVDSAGLAHQVTTAVAPPQRWFAAMLHRLLNRPMNVELVLAESAPVGLPDAKVMVADSIQQHRHFWASGGSPASLTRRVKQAASFTELTGIFA